MTNFVQKKQRSCRLAKCIASLAKKSLSLSNLSLRNMSSFAMERWSRVSDGTRASTKGIIAVDQPMLVS